MKTCYYELLGVSSTADDLELKKAFRRKALQYHPDKNRENVEEATETFAQIRAAYEVLNDPQERAWYDSHKSQILNDDINGGTYEDDEYGSYAMDTGVTSEELLMFFNSSLYTRLDDTPAGFYQIAGKVFARLAKDEVLHGRMSGFKEFNRYDDDYFESKISSNGYVKACDDRIKEMLKDDSRCLFPPFGSSATDYEVLKTFYKKWSSFNTVKSFRWKDEYMYSSIYDRRTKREINKRNDKIRQQSRNEYNKTVKRFVTFIKKLDRRVQEGERKAKESKRESERAKFQELKRTAQREQPQFEMQSWQTIDENKWDDLEKLYSGGEENSDYGYDNKNDNNNTNNNDNEKYENGDSDEYVELIYDCFVCNKRFKSENQLENHNNTKAHRKNVKKIQRQMKKEDFALGLDDLSDLDDYASAQSREDEEEDQEEQEDEEQEAQSEDESEDESDDEELKKLEEELAQIEQQLKGVSTSDEKNIPVQDENDVNADVDVEVEKSDSESLLSQDKEDEEFQRSLADLDKE
ncbi:hypothetical protein ZYGR_0U02950 [Zygosaccharomyces rouxii]|uniref:J domain-containing protein n=1 Tax=Zygosaccharomyces rouxii TaxID=4956 RepID=A0A1Q3A428_ZYGRO|nr:hypothetical protein ZYGR_0U02950 [Zygosaccharomyces rouxii]